MCELCGIKNDTSEYLMGEDVEGIFFSEATYTSQDCEMSVGIEKDAADYLQLVFEFDAEDGRANRETDDRFILKFPLDYCPWCGRELKHKPKRQLNK